MNKTLRLLAGMTALMVAVAAPAAAFGLLGVDLGLTGDEDNVEATTDVISTSEGDLGVLSGLMAHISVWLSLENDGDLTDNVGADVSLADGDADLVDDVDLDVSLDEVTSASDGCLLQNIDINADLSCVDDLDVGGVGGDLGDLDAGGDVLDGVNVDDVDVDQGIDNCDLLGNVDLDVVGGLCGTHALDDLSTDLDAGSVAEQCDGILDDLPVDLEGATADASEGDWNGLIISIQAFVEGIIG